jgi:hypothetical protein
VERRLELMREAGVRARMTDAAAALPILAAGPAMLDEEGGVIWTVAAIRALVAALGDAIVTGEVVEVAPSGEVRAGDSVATYDRVIVCAGRDTALLAGRLELPVQVWTHTRIRCASRGCSPACSTASTARTATPCPGRRATRSGGATPILRTTSPSACRASSRGPSRRVRAGSPSCPGATTASRSGRRARCGSSPAATCSSTRLRSGGGSLPMSSASFRLTWS